METILESGKHLQARGSKPDGVESSRGLVKFQKEGKKSDLKTDFSLKEQDSGAYRNLEEWLGHKIYTL